ncbi:MAG: hypothetical protein IJW18_06290 [Lachnospiraceae bacterium]|nr:hypothetical protein [Lachnospiraceae bacterium]
MEIYIIGIVGIVLFVIVQFYLAQRNQKRRFLEKLKATWGKVPQREYSYEEFESITHYYKNRIEKSETTASEVQYIDDITWNDLDMDQIFMQMNNTHSSPGEEYLYYMLRTPVTSKEILDERERLISFFQKNEEERRTVQLAYGKIGRTKGLSASDYISRLNDVQRESNWNHYLIFILYAVCAVIFSYEASLGIMCFVGAFIYAAVRYYRRKAEIEAYFTCFKIISNIISNIPMLKKCNVSAIETYVARMEKEASELKGINKSMGMFPSDNLGGSIFDAILDYVRIATHMDLIKFNNMLSIFIKKQDALETIIENFGFIESMIAVASFRESLDYYSLPVFTDKKVIEFEEMYHPVLDKPVANSIHSERCVLITGSNASGKSTFLKSAAINAILAQSANTVAAKAYKACWFRVMSSMALKDNLLGSESYYIVEIKSLKRVLDAVNDKITVLCFVDEVLRGTNTVERIAASSQILKSLAERNVLCFAATHDIELTHILESKYDNYHFTEHVTDNDITFDYKLNRGRATSRNAIRLLKMIGYDDDIIDKANDNAQYFLSEGKWKQVNS